MIVFVCKKKELNSRFCLIHCGHSLSFRVGRNIRSLESAEIALGRAPFHESHGNERAKKKERKEERENAIGEVEKAIRAYV